MSKFLIGSSPHSVFIRIRGDEEPCAACTKDVEVFTWEAGHARFLIVRLADHPALGGGKCPGCLKYYCIACATKTVYGAGLRRLHCPTCGRFLVGLRRAPDSIYKLGAFLEEPPGFSGRPTPTVAAGEVAEAANFFEIGSRPPEAGGNAPTLDPEADDDA